MITVKITIKSNLIYLNYVYDQLYLYTIYISITVCISVIVTVTITAVKF